jgi:hypothetical protein
MFTTSFTSLRRLSGQVLTLLLSTAALCAPMAAQTPSVVSSFPVAVPHNESYGNPWQVAVDNHGDFVLFDFKTGGVYEYPGNGGPEITIGAPNQLAGGFTDSGIAIDPRNNNMYLNNNYNGGLMELPYDSATGTWDLPPVVVAGGLAGNLGGTCGNYFQSAGMAINDNGVLAVATENGCGVEIFTVPIDASGNFGAATPIISNMSGRARTVAIDDAGNISFTEDTSSGIPGAFFLPAGTVGLSGDTGLTRIDPEPGTPLVPGNVSGVSTDKAGNLYITYLPDGIKPNEPQGVYLVPLESGAPNPAQAVLLADTPAPGNAVLDQAHSILFVPITTWQGFKDVVKIYLNRSELGATAVGSAPGAPATITYTFESTVTPNNFLIEQNGGNAFATGSLTGCGIVTATDPKTNQPITTYTTYNAGQTCTIPVTFTPTTTGDYAATLVMLDKSNNVLASTELHGLGQGSDAIVSPGLEAPIGSGLQAPSQVATDASGNVYVADSGLGKVLQYPKGAGAITAPVSIGTGLTAPTGVAVDGSGNVLIADSGNVIEVPYGPTGLSTAGQSTLFTGFGTNVKLAVDGVGNIFVADPDNQRVAEFTNLVVGSIENDITGLNQLSAITADGSGDVFFAAGQNLIEIPAFGTQTTVLNSLSGATGLAVDPSGSVYVTSATQTVRIPNQSGTLNASSAVTIAPDVIKPTSVAVDASSNVYITDAAAEDVDYVDANGLLNLGTLATITSTSTASATIFDAGNLPLNITAFSATPDYSVTTNTCVGTPVSLGGSCSATVTFNPGAGDQGSLTGQLILSSDAVNSPVAIDTVGVGAALSASTTTITVTNPTVTNVPVAVNVVSSSGTGPVPTGNITITVTGSGFSPITSTQPLVNGTYSVNLTTVPAGADTFTANYGGDRIYGTSTSSTKVTVGQGSLSLIQPTLSAVPTYVLSGGTGSFEPYDSSQIPYYYNYPLSVITANGAPLLGVPILDTNGKQVGIDYGHVTYQVAGGVTACTGSGSIINVNADGTAPLPTNCLDINNSNNQIPDVITSYTITPIYTGNTDPNYTPVTGTPFTVIAIRNPMVIITSNPATLSVSAGSTTSATLTLTSLLGYGVLGVNGDLNNYSLPVAMDCDGLPAHATCSFSYATPDPSDPHSVDVTPTAPGQVVMTINTNVAVGTSSTAGFGRNWIAFLAVFVVSLLGLAFGKKRSLRSALLSGMCLLLFSGAIAGLSACSTAQIGTTPILTTQKGTYTITVTAKQVGSKVIPGNTPGTTQTVYGNGNQMSIPFTMTLNVQ